MGMDSDTTMNDWGDCLMASDYDFIRKQNMERYGTDIKRVGDMLLANRYDDRTHFIFELLQNAEDALALRKDWNGCRSVQFYLSNNALSLIHFGKPFDEEDVRGICGIAEGTKDVTAIGHFGIGFKSVYAFTDRPQIHSGAEDFAIENYVWPTAVTPHPRGPNETIIIIPLKSIDAAERGEIADGLQRLGARTLMFLREIDEIKWEVEGGSSGCYLRDKPENLGDGVRRVNVIGYEEGAPDIEEHWLIFSKPVTTDDGMEVGYVEVAVSMTRDEKTGQERVIPIARSPLVVYFPTILETHLGFLIQGPYRTTPSRDNVPPKDPWNQHCVKETADLLVEALRWLRDRNMLSSNVLRCLPIDPAKFGEDSMFAPLFCKTKDVLRTEPLIPRFGGGYVAAVGSRLARTQELRELINPSQLASLLGIDGEIAWLSSEITQDRTLELLRYITQELGVSEITPDTILTYLNSKAFLEAQSDAWIVQLYEFLNGQPRLLKRLKHLPLVRLQDGSHVPPYSEGEPQAFLPGKSTTEFPTVRTSVCTSDSALEFLESLGLTEASLVDDVVRNILPKYREQNANIEDARYGDDIRSILTAFSTDSKAQQDKLIRALRDTPFVMAVDSGDGKKSVSKPTEVYQATERLKRLFTGVKGVLLIDDKYSCLRGEAVRELLEECGAARYLEPVRVESDLSWEQLRDIRRNAGLESYRSRDTTISDWTLRGLDALLALLPQLDFGERRHRAALFWDALADLEREHGPNAFLGEYMWGYYQQWKRATFDAKFIRTLNENQWVPDCDGNLQCPEFVSFESLNWESNSFLQSRIRFKPALQDRLEHEAGIEPGLIGLLKELGVTTKAELCARLGIDAELTVGDGKTTTDADDLPGESVPESPDRVQSNTGQTVITSTVSRGGDPRIGHRSRVESDGSPADSRDMVTAGESDGIQGDSKLIEKGKGRQFISYVAVHPKDEESDPDSLDQLARMELEAKAINFILAREPDWQPTPVSNPGFDLLKTGPDGTPTCWCEVKAMTCNLKGRPVGLSRPQFEFALLRGTDYWLYIVEHAGSVAPRIVRIQDPAGKARTFTFDHGWIDIAELDDTPDEGASDRCN